MRNCTYRKWSLGCEKVHFYVGNVMIYPGKYDNHDFLNEKIILFQIYFNLISTKYEYLRVKIVNSQKFLETKIAPKSLFLISSSFLVIFFRHFSEPSALSLSTRMITNVPIILYSIYT